MQTQIQISLKYIFILVMLCTFSSAHAQNVQIQYNFNTGDKELDISLNNYNINAKADINNFVTDLSVTYRMDKVKIELLLNEKKMEPAEILMSAMISDVSDKNIDDVVAVYETSKKQGWGVIAKEMGIKPGSKEFHELKNKSKEISGKGNSNKNNKSQGKSKGKK